MTLRVLHISLSPGNDGHHARTRREIIGLLDAGFDMAFHDGGKRGKSDQRGNELPDLSGFDIVHTHDVRGTAEVARELRRMIGKRPLFVQGVHFNGGYNGGMARVSALADAVVCVSEHDRRELATANPDIADKIHCIHTCIDSEFYGRVAKRANAPIRVGMYGSSKRKGVDLFEQVAAALPQYKFEIAGAHGTATGNLTYMGRLDHMDFSEWLGDLDIYVQPSRAESLGTALMEAGASGCACIGSAVGGIPEIVLPGVTGMLFQPGDAKSLTESVTRLAEHEDLRWAYSSSMQRHVATVFPLQRMIDETAALYRTLVGVTA